MSTLNYEAHRAPGRKGGVWPKAARVRRAAWGLLRGLLGAAHTVDAALCVTVAPAKVATGRHMLQNRQGDVIENKIRRYGM
ncbi:hypothetical protein E4U14_001135 [Claviceps sp. LM454 group G7]|nr:hypothetical protein E4U14_001135 [Claviceps sp. LM454 group G7]